jgi:hypothetical protein
MIDFFLFKIDPNMLMLWIFRIIFWLIGLIYVIYVLLQIRQIGIMNKTLKTSASDLLKTLGYVHLILVVIVVVSVEIIVW